MKVYALHPAQFKLDGGAMFGIIPKPLWEKKIKADDLNRITMSLRVVLVQTGNKNILIDTGIGTYHSNKFNQQFDIRGSNNPLIDCLKELDLKSDDITDLILTHLHFDHVGGIADKEGNILFPNATIHLHENHWKYSLQPSARDQGSFHSHIFKDIIQEMIDQHKVNFLQDNEDGEIADTGLKYKVSFGHTPYMIHPYNDQFIYMADLVPMSHHISIPWVMGYDIEPATTTVYKERFYKDIITKNLVMIFEHDIETIGCTLKIDEKNKYQADKVFKSQTNLYELLNI